jgi:flavin-dependent dehydrogenase
VDSAHFDVVIIGGGPAGSCAAAFCRRRGLSVVVAEKEDFPRFRIGESLLPMGNGVLRATGVWPKIEQAGFVEKFGARFCLSNGSLEKRINFCDGYVPGLERTFQVERAKFDELLLDHARELGADVRLQTRVSAVAETETHVDCVLSSEHAGSSEHVRASWVINAGGRENLHTCGRCDDLDPSPFPKRVAIYNHFHNVRRPSGPEGGDTVIVRLNDGWFWVIPIDADRTSVGLVTTSEQIKRNGGEPADVFRNTVSASRKLTELMKGAIPAAPFRVTTDYSYFRRELATSRIVHVGDAAGFFDPIFSSGVYMSTWSAQLAVDMVANAGSAGLSRSQCVAYTKRVKTHAGVFRRLIEMFYDPYGFSMFMSQKPPFDLERGINSIVAGHATLTWPLWWRFNFFLAVCRLQRRLKLVPPIECGWRVAS